MERTRKPSLGRKLLLGLGLLAGLFAVVVVVCLALGWRAFGHRAVAQRQQRMKGSPQWRGSHFGNPQPLANSLWGSLKAARNASPYVSPAGPLAVPPLDPQRFAVSPATGLRVTWLGHSTVLVEMDGQRVLTDPVWSDRATPIAGIGPRRFFALPIALKDLPHIDAVVISHDHYDHLDYATISAMKDWDTRFVVPLGIGAHLEYWGVPAAHIVELDWWEPTQVGALQIVCTPARHASGRVLLDNDAKLWAGYALLSPQHRVYYSGDTGLFPAMRDIGSRLGPFDLTMIEVGQYGSSWPDWHIGPEQAVLAHQLVRGRLLLPVHWGAFALAFHGWTEPIERVLQAGEAAGAELVVPRPGQSFEPQAPPRRERWWPEIPWQTGVQAPIVSTQFQ